MNSRQNFDSLLQKLKEKLLTLSELVEQSLHNSVESLRTLDGELAEEVIAGDNKIDDLEIEIDEDAVRLIATQQPVARDLRKIISAIKIASDLERVADLSVNIAKVTIRLQGQKLVKPLIDIPKMAENAQKMLRVGIDSYIKEDIALAKQLKDMDDTIDHMYKSILNELIELMVQDSQIVNQGQQLGFAARYIERIADHITNIGESVIYLVSGKRHELND
ncbi:phosphate transport system regulatory protein PhoU [Vulcanibacillus modesticaldus]|uniref:Phosphate-specific transport system accessory protein PhoU n=1 Tax=Vulcanibacillus modesticaldus TaxID=337097 RepID=A0A1D2YSV4_9BACI|nr:phosphate signaling complex protein PhoU [Vulcanibacillus modesticaldus]OEF98088.1 phosphate transport system regulatory protein PhoU [Vulcanibacillus modesticaldus]